MWAVSVAAAIAAREVGEARESARLLADATYLQPRWRGQTQSAVECSAHKILSHASDFYWTHFLHAQCVGRGEAADTHDRTLTQIEALSNATKLKPDWALAYNDMGLRFGFWQQRGDLMASVRYLSHAVSLEPHSWIYTTNLAMAYQHMGQLAKAADFSRRAATLMPDDAQVQQQLGRGKLSHAVPHVCIL